MSRARPTTQPPSGFFVLLNEEHGYALWFWVPGMPGGTLEGWWRTVDAAAVGRSPLFFDRRNLPGRCVLADRDTWNRLYTEGKHWHAHAHWEDDSYLARPDHTFTYHRGHPDVRRATPDPDPTMRAVRAPTLTCGHRTTAGDATLTAEISEHGARLRIHGLSEGETGRDEEQVEWVYTLDEIDAATEALVTGRDTTRAVTSGGREHRSTWSWSAPSGVFEDGRFLWFYPMDQRRATLRILASPLRAALHTQLAWLAVGAPGLPAADQEAIRRAQERLRCDAQGSA